MYLVFLKKWLCELMFLTTDNQAPQIERDVFVTSNAKAKKNKVKKSMNFKQVL